jgi:hypothetical protein
MNAGRYYQLPSYTTLGYRSDNATLVNKSNGIRYIGANHWVAGIDYRRNPSSKLTIEGFYKTYDHYPFSVSDSISLASKGADFGVAGAEAASPVSEGRAWGAELFYRDRIGKHFETTITYTWVRSQFKDKKNEYIPSAWDNGNLLNITGLATFGKNWEVGFKWRFVGGAPYTPYDYELSSLKEAWDIRGQGYLDYDQYNMKRLKAFHQLDVRLDKELFFKKWSINIYLDIQNLYNFKAQQPDILVPVRDANGLPVTDPQNEQRYSLKYLANDTGTVLPSLGIIVEL